MSPFTSNTQQANKWKTTILYVLIITAQNQNIKNARVFCFLFSVQVSSEAMAAPVSSKEGGGLSSRRRRHHISESGVLVVERSEPSDAGQPHIWEQPDVLGGLLTEEDEVWSVDPHWPALSGIYTCVAWNREGADTRSVSVFVDSVGGQAGDVSWWDGAPSREQNWNVSNTASSLVVVAKVRAFSLFFFCTSDFVTRLHRPVTLQTHVRWWMTSRWCWSGSCFPAVKRCRRGRISCTCPSGSAPPCTSTTLR